jgi:hypothetical protein
MTQHNIIGSERSGPHVAIRYGRTRSRGWPWWLLTSVQLAVCAAPVAFIIALIRIAEAMQ